MFSCIVINCHLLLKKNIQKCLKSNKYDTEPEYKNDCFYFVIKLQTDCHNVVRGGGTLHPETAGEDDGDEGHHPGSGPVEKPG